jgi:DNA-binding transcriptional MerR regulator
MRDQFTIGDVAHRTGVPIKTIRFYEAEGVIPAAARTEAGYRLYTPTDVRRLHLVRRLRLLGLPLPEVAHIVAQAFASACDAYAQQVLELIDRQRVELDRQIAELVALRAELDAVAGHVRHVLSGAPTGLTVATCTRCPLIDEATGEESFCGCAPAAVPVPGAPDQIPLITVHEERSGTAMTQETFIPNDVLEVLRCDISAWPAGAPTHDDLAPALRSLRREGEMLTIAFDPAAAETVDAFAAAVQRCCSGIGFEVERDDVERGESVILRVRATTDQLDVLAQTWPQAGGR